MAVPGAPVLDEETQKQLKSLVAKGFAGGLFFATEDIKATYEELKYRGVEFQQEPTEQPYGVDGRGSATSPAIRCAWRSCSRPWASTGTW